MAPAFPPTANEKRRPPAQSPSHRGRNRSKQKELPKGSPLVLGQSPPYGKAHRIARPTESREIPRFFKLGRAFRVCYTQPMNGLGIEMRRLGWQGRSLPFQ